MTREFRCRRVTHTISLLPIYNRRADDSLRCKPQLETLEARHLMTASPGPDWSAALSAGVCSCPICTGQGLNGIAATETVGSGSGTLAASNPLSFLPQLSSNPGATAKLYLDFNGNTETVWGNWSNVITPVYDQDGDRTTFSDAELASIQEIWARVAEDYAPFNIDVTTIDPGNNTDRVTARIAIGGNYSDWYGSSAGGVAYIGGFAGYAPNTGFVFEDALGNGNARYVAEAASHEAGHLFGLSHQATWNGTQLVANYSQGNADWAPIMGVGYYSQRTTWHDGATSDSWDAYQDDMWYISHVWNGFGYRADDYGSTQDAASALAATSDNVNMAGLIGTNTDEDWFTFTTSGGALNLSLNVAQVGANLDSVLEIRDASGSVIVTANPTNSLNASISTTLTSGTYFVIVRSSGGYGNVGQYTLAGTAPVGTTGGGGSGGENTAFPEIDVANGGTAIQSGGSVSFGSVQVGNYVDRTLTIHNSGNGPLTLTSPTAGDMPAGYSIVSNLGTNTLAAGASTTITIRFTPTAAGTTAGSFTLVSDDSNEGSFVINLTGTATPAPAPEITVLNGTTNVLSGGSVSFGSVQVGQYVNKVLTIKNTGTGPLTLTAPTAGDMPAGYSIVTNLGSTTLAAGASTTITIRFTPTAAGTTTGALTLLSDDADEGSFVINFTGSATPAPAPEITVLNGTVNVLTGGTVDFGNVQVSKYLNKTITIKNTGNATLTLVKPTAAQMPAGFTIVTNFATTSLVAGTYTTLTVRYTPTAVGATGGALTLVSNDADEGSFVINLTGTGTPGPQPEINVNVGTLGIQTGGTVDFGDVQVTKYANKVITIKNTGTATLTLVKPTAAQMPAGFTIITNFTTTSLAVGSSTTITLRYTPTSVGPTSGVLNLVSNDADEGTFALNLTGNGLPGPQPEINVNVGTLVVQSGGTIDWGNVQVGKYLNKVITIKNSGPGTLTLVKPTALDMPAGYTIVTNFASTSLASGASASITLRYTPTAVGAAGGLLNLVSNDADEGTFALNLTGTGTPGPQPEINVNVGTLVVQSGGTIDWGNVQVGKYVNKVITIKNSGPGTLTLVKPTALDMPAGYTIVTNFASTSLASGASASITLRFTPSAVGAAGGLLNLVSNDADEGSFALNLTGNGTPGPQPEINVNVGTLVVQSGGTIDWGNVEVGKYLNKVITIKNSGPGTLTLVKPTALDMPAGYTIVTNFASTSLASGASASITLRFTPSAVGAAGGLLNLVSNDADEGTFALNLTGNGTPAPIIRAIDNGAAGFTSTGTWTKYTFLGRETDMQIATKGNGSTTATWTFTSMPPGQYRVHATWVGSIIYASNAPFTVYDGSTAVGTVFANQETSSSGFSWGGSNWKDLGTFNITGDTISVTLTNAANETVVADAVRIERIGDLPSGAPASVFNPALSLASTLPDALPLPNSAPSDIPATPPSSTNVFAPVVSLLTGTPNNSSFAIESVDEVFAAAGDAQAELLLLDAALDLLETTPATTSEHEESDEGSGRTDSFFAADWLDEPFGSHQV